MLGFLTLFNLAHSFGSDEIGSTNTEGSMPKLQCRDKNGSTLTLSMQEEGTASLVYAGVEKVFGEGLFQLDPVVISKNLNCGFVGSQIKCASIEEQIIDVPKAGINNQKVMRESTFTIGNFWENETRFDNQKPSQHLILRAQFNISLQTGEVLKPVLFNGTNLKSSEKVEFKLNKSEISLVLTGNGAGYETIK